MKEHEDSNRNERSEKKMEMKPKEAERKLLSNVDKSEIKKNVELRLESKDNFRKKEEERWR